MNIKVLGTGCSNCKKLETNVEQAILELKLKAEVEKITEIQDIMKYDILSLPALVIDGHVAICGRIAEVEEIKSLLSKK